MRVTTSHLNSESTFLRRCFAFIRITNYILYASDLFGESWHPATTKDEYANKA